MQLQVKWHTRTCFKVANRISSASVPLSPSLLLSSSVVKTKAPRSNYDGRHRMELLGSCPKCFFSVTNAPLHFRSYPNLFYTLQRWDIPKQKPSTPSVTLIAASILRSSGVSPSTYLMDTDKWDGGHTGTLCLGAKNRRAKTLGREGQMGKTLSTWN